MTNYFLGYITGILVAIVIIIIQASFTPYKKEVSRFLHDNCVTVQLLDKTFDDVKNEVIIKFECK